MQDEYRFWVEEKVPDAEASRRVIERYAGDDDHELWLALAATQWKLGRLDPEVKRRALLAIDEGQGLDLWEGKQVAARTKALAALRNQLAQPQPPRREIRPKWAATTDLTVGDVIAVHLDDQNVVALRVVWVMGVGQNTRWRSPVFEVYRWVGSGLPSIDDLKTLLPEMQSYGPYPKLVEIMRLRRRDPDWRETGFTLIGHWPVSDPETPETMTGFAWHVAIQHFRSPTR